MVIYPTFEMDELLGLIPKLYLPRDFKNLVPNFYKEGRKETVKNYAVNLEKELFVQGYIRLQWSEEKGLTNLSLLGGGLDLIETGMPSFQIHNIGTQNGIPLGLVAMKYISELIKSSDD